MLKYPYEEQGTKAMAVLLDDHYLGLQMNTTFMDAYVSDKNFYLNQKLKSKISNLESEN